MAEEELVNEHDEYADAFAARARQDSGEKPDSSAGEEQESPQQKNPVQEDAAEDAQQVVQQQEMQPDSGTGEEEFVSAQKFKVASGRLQAVSRENAELKARLAEIEAAGSQPAPQMQEQEVPDELREDLAVIAAIDPDLAGLVREQSADGDKLRKALVKIGPESTLALAESMRTRRMVEQREAGNNARLQKDAAHAHYDALLGSVQELADVAVPGLDQAGNVLLFPLQGKESEFQSLFSGLNEWVDELPHRQAREIQEILSRGSADAIAGVFKKYGQSRQPREHVDARHADELASVPSRPGKASVAADSIDPDSYEGAFARRAQEAAKRARD